MGLYRMPSLGADMEAGTLVEWLVAPGAAVSRGDVVAVVETQKGAIEIEIFETGVLARRLVEVGETVPVGAPLAEIRAPGEAAAEAKGAEEERPAETVAGKAPAEPAEAIAPAPPPERPPSPAPPSPAPAPAAGRPRASPAARRLAEAQGVDLAGLRGSGPGGAIALADVESALSGPAAPAPRRATGLDLGEMRKAIAAAMARSKREIPHYYLSHEVDVGAARDWVAARNADLPPAERFLLGLLLVRAVARAAGRYPELNGFHEAGGFRPAEAVHVGVAVAIRGGGLVAPALHEAETRPLPELMAAFRDLVARARAGRLRSSEMTDATITVSSLGERGVDALAGVIYPPQVALVGVGTPRERPAVVDGAVVPRPLATLTLAADHRASDGHRGALFLAEIARLMQEPDSL
ncbi:dihydrolipoamide acetyltransferase family protein [Salinarimonas sp.]|uniref:dihydrolipoamide acetyltransferase family protein n=1 Tax=Salinarimonas sp. TaxID=2766526 RepID=UPI0032D9A54F